MRLAISNLAWPPEFDDDVRALLERRGVHGLEVAPMKYWAGAPHVADDAIRAFREYWLESGIQVVALQGVLFGHPSLQLFGTSAEQDAFVAHFRGISRLAGLLGAGVIVLGAPKNRLRRSLPVSEAMHVAANVLRRLALDASDHGTTICIEPNPPEYGGDFVLDGAEALRLVREVDHAGFGLQLDAGATSIVREDDEMIATLASVARHYHVSEVGLVPVGSNTVDHMRMAGLLRRGRYAGWTSIEMLPPSPASSRADVVRSINDALDVAESAYGSDD